MPPKKRAAEPQASSKPAPAEETDDKKTSARAVAVRKPATHPTTAVMVREALKALDSRKGVSSQALQSHIKQKYPTVEPVRLKHLVRRILKNGLLNGTLVRPVNATVTTGALGKFRLAPKVKEVKLKSENTDPNVQKPKAGAKKTQTEDSTKKKKPTNEKAKSTKNPKPPKTTKDKAAAPSKVPPAKKPKAKKVAATGSAAGSSAGSAAGSSAGSAAGSSEPTKNKTAKAKGAKTEKKTQSKVVKSGSDAPASKTAGKRVKKAL